MTWKILQTHVHIINSIGFMIVNEIVLYHIVNGFFILGNSYVHSAKNETTNHSLNTFLTGEEFLCVCKEQQLCTTCFHPHILPTVFHYLPTQALLTTCELTFSPVLHSSSGRVTLISEFRLSFQNSNFNLRILTLVSEF